MQPLLAVLGLPAGHIVWHGGQGGRASTLQQPDVSLGQAAGVLTM